MVYAKGILSLTLNTPLRSANEKQFSYMHVNYNIIILYFQKWVVNVESCGI